MRVVLSFFFLFFFNERSDDTERGVNGGRRLRYGCSDKGGGRRR